MKKLNNLSESDFLKLLFGFFTLAFLVAAPMMPDRSNMLSGLWQIVSQPSKISTNYFAVGGYAATFLNMGLVALFCLALYVLFGAVANNVSTLAFLLTLGFTSWGINVLNMWPSVLGVVLYSLVKREKCSANVNAMLFSTGIAPLITELMVRYPYAEAVGFRVSGVALAIFVGLAIGFFLPAGLAHAPKVHKGYDLYNAAVPVGMTAFFLQAVLYKSMGVALPAAPAAETLTVASRATANTFCLIVFGVLVLIALAMGCTPKDYWALMMDKSEAASFSATYGKAAFLMNVGVYGLFILGYYNLVGASFNGATFGVMFCMLSTCNSGSHPLNAWPMLLGYMVASPLMHWLSRLVGGHFTYVINTQSILIGACYSNGMTPIVDKYGPLVGFFAGILHFLLVTSVPLLHGGYCLYNGGFTAAFVCLLLIPILERFTKTKSQLLAEKADAAK